MTTTAMTARDLAAFTAAHTYLGPGTSDLWPGTRLRCSCGHVSERLSSQLSADDIAHYDDPDWHLDHLDDELEIDNGETAQAAKYYDGIEHVLPQLRPLTATAASRDGQ